MVPAVHNMYILRLIVGQLREPYSDVEITVTAARSKLPELIDTQIRDGGVVHLTRYGQRVGAVVPAEVAERFEHWEEAIADTPQSPKWLVHQSVLRL